ncbi:MAG: DUF1552 domain-containing protein [Myxococcota bacterium]
MSPTDRRPWSWRKWPGTRLSRRQVLGGLGASLLTPFVPLLRARAEGALRRPTNLLLVYHPNGLEEGWQPTGGRLDFTLSQVLAPLEPYRDQLLILGGFRGGIQNEVQAHSEGMASMWTGARLTDPAAFAGHPSIDQLVAQQLGASTLFPSLELGVQSQSGAFRNTTAMIYRGAGQPLQPEDDPNQLYERVFGAALGDPRQIAQKRQEQGSILDLVMEDLRAVQAHYGTADRLRLEAHQEALRSIERRLDQAGQLTCEAQFDGHSLTRRQVVADSVHFPFMSDLQMELIALAFTCGLTRVASLQYSDSTSAAAIPGVNDDQGIHAVMHTGTRLEKVRINTWFAGQLAVLLDKLQSVVFEDGTTLLDETLVVWGTEMAVGNHLNDPIPFIVAGGGADGYFNLGQWVHYSDKPRHTRLLITLLHAMGLEEIQALGDYRDADERLPLDTLRRRL